MLMRRDTAGALVRLDGRSISPTQQHQPRTYPVPDILSSFLDRLQLCSRGCVFALLGTDTMNEYRVGLVRRVKGDVLYSEIRAAHLINIFRNLVV